MRLILLTGIGIVGYWYLASSNTVAPHARAWIETVAHASEVFPDMKLRPNPNDGKPLSWTPDYDSFPREIRQLNRQQQIEALRTGR
jgi:hypothetical protein